MTEPRKYRPSNGTEGMMFTDEYCARCIHEKFMHTNNHEDLKCDILSRTMLYDIHEKEYPEEWTWNQKGEPICTAHKYWDWDSGDDRDGLNEPPPVFPDDPNQLCLPFIFDEIGIKQVEKELANAYC